MRSFSVWRQDVAGEIIAGHAAREGALLPMLHALQHEFGWVPDEAVPMMAQALNLSRADVHGVLTFYHDFRRELAGQVVVKLCQAEACQARGAREIARQAEAKLGVAMGETRADGAVTLEPIYCLGLCASGPAALIDDHPVARLDAAKLERVLDEAVR